MCRSSRSLSVIPGDDQRSGRPYHMSAKTPELLLEGFLYDSSPRLSSMCCRPQKVMLELPVSWATDDWPPAVHAPDLDYMFQIVAPDRAMEVFMAEFEALRACPGGL